MKQNKKTLKKICFLTTTLEGGGAQRVMVNIANCFARDGYETHIICFVAKNTPIIYQLDPHIVLHNLPRGYSKNDRILKRCVRMLTDLIRVIDPDVMIPFLMPVTAYSYKVAKRLGVKIIVSERNDPNITPTDPFWKKQRDYIFKHADGCIFQTVDALEYFGRETIANYSIIKNPIELTGVRTDMVLASNRTHRIVCVGKYEPQKNLDFLLEIFSEFVKQYPDYHLEIYGNDFHGHRLTLQQKAISMGLEHNVHLHLAKPDVLNLIYDARMSVLPSKYEGMPNALIESVSIGIPSIASDCPAYGGRQIITSGENGFLLEVDDKKAFVEHMCKIASDDFLSDKLSMNGKKVRNKFDLDEVYSCWKNFVTKVVEENEKL